jgi:hypothetical protein
VHNCGSESAEPDPEGAAKIQARVTNTLINAGTNALMSGASQHLNNKHGTVSVPQVLAAGVLGGVFGGLASMADPAEMSPASYILANAAAGSLTDIGENVFDQVGNNKPFDPWQVGCWALIGGASGAGGGALGAYGESQSSWTDHVTATLGTAYSGLSSGANLAGC